MARSLRRWGRCARQRHGVGERACRNVRTPGFQDRIRPRFWAENRCTSGAYPPRRRSNPASGFATITCTACRSARRVHPLVDGSWPRLAAECIGVSDVARAIEPHPRRTDMRTRMTVVGTLTSAVAVLIAGAVVPVAGQSPAAAAKAPVKRGGQGVDRAQDAVGRSGCIGNLVDRRPARRADPASGPVRRAVGAVGRGIRGEGGRQRPGGNARVEWGRSVSQRRRHPHVPAHVARHRSGRRPHAPDDARGASARRPRRRHSAPRRAPAWISLYDRCITRGVFGSLLPSSTATAPHLPDARRVVTYEMSTTRESSRSTVVRTSVTSSASNGDRAATGKATRSSSRPRTSRQHDRRRRQRRRHRHSDKMKMTERFTRIDPEMINYKATVDDPVSYTQP